MQPSSSQRLTILIVSDVSIASVIGGAERVLFEQSIRLVELGHDVHVLTRRLPSHRKNKKIIQGVREWRYDVSQKSTISFLKTSRRNAKLLFKYLQGKYSFDCINFHQPFSAFGVIQSPLCKNIKKTYTCHSLSFEEFISRTPKPDGLADKALYFLNIHARKWVEKRVLKESDNIITLSQFTRDKLESAYEISPEKVSIIPGGVDLEMFQPAVDKIMIRQRLNVPAEKVIMFTVRNLVRRMGLENLILALKAVVETAPDIYLVLAGEGPLKDDLISLVKQLALENFVEFTGFIPEDLIPDYYRMADLFVLPTLELEGFGLVTLESMASGVPVLGTPVGGTLEILSKFDHEFIFKDMRAESIADLIIKNYWRIKEDPDVWNEISNKCCEFVKRNYSWEKNVASLEKVFMT